MRPDPPKRKRNPKGTGAVVSKNGRWYHRRNESGTEIYGPGRTEKHEAEQDRINWIKGAATPKTSGIPTIADWCYQTAQEYEGSDATHDTNESIRRHHVLGSAIAQKKLHQVTRQMVLDWAKNLTATKTRAEGGERIAYEIPASLHWKKRCVAYLSRRYTLAHEAGILDRNVNPCRSLRLGTVPERENRTLDPTETARLLNPQNRAETIMLFAALTGSRRGEIQRIEWRHVNFARAQVTIPGTKTESSRNRVVPLAKPLADALEKLDCRGPYVFGTATGKMMSARNISRDVNDAKERLGIPPETRLQDLRGTFASLLLDAGVGLRAVMEMGGWSKVDTLLKMYARSRNPVKESAIQNLADVIQKAGEVDKGKE